MHNFTSIQFNGDTVFIRADVEDLPNHNPIFCTCEYEEMPSHISVELDTEDFNNIAFAKTIIEGNKSIESINIDLYGLHFDDETGSDTFPGKCRQTLLKVFQHGAYLSWDNDWSNATFEINLATLIAEVSQAVKEKSNPPSTLA